MSNEQEKQNDEEITIITEEGNDNAEYLKNRKKKKIYSKLTNTEDDNKVTESIDYKLEDKLESISTMSVISVIFYIFSVLTIIGMFGYLSKVDIEDVQIMSIQFFIICSYVSSAFIFFSFGKIFEVVNKIDKTMERIDKIRN